MSTADNLLSLATRQMEQDEHAEAVTSLQRVLRRRPRDVEARSRLARSLQGLGKVAEAEASYRKALQMHAGYAPAHVGLGTLLANRGQYDQAIENYQKALQLQPDRVDANFGIASAYGHREQFSEAARYYGRVLDINPRHVATYNNLGNLFRAKDDLSASEKCHRMAIRLQPEVGTHYYNLGLTLNRMGEHREATEAFEAAHARISSSADIVAALAKNYEYENRLDDAWRLATEAVQLDQDHVLANVVMATCDQRAGRLDSAQERLERIRPLARLDHERQFIAGELGRVLDKSKQFDQAFEEFTEANRLGARTAGQQAVDARAAGLAEIEQLRSLFQPVHLAHSSDALPWDSERSLPVFLVGFPRSGTTLLDQALDAHPAIQTMSEKPAIAAVKQQLEAWYQPYTSGLLSLSDAQTRALRSLYFEIADRHAARGEGQLIVDKHPLNIRHLGLIDRLFPGAKVIVALRHPFDCCLSCFMQLFKANAGMSNFFTLCDAATYYAAIMSLWQQFSQVLQQNQHVIRYESLVTDFDSQMRELLEFIELDWHDGVLAYAEHASQRGRINTPSYRQVVQPIYNTARYRWRNYAKHLEGIAPLLAPLIASLGYELEQ